MCKLVHASKITSGIDVAYLRLHLLIYYSATLVQTDTDLIQFIYDYIRFSSNTNERLDSNSFPLIEGMLQQVQTMQRQQRQ